MTSEARAEWKKIKRAANLQLEQLTAQDFPVGMRVKPRDGREGRIGRINASVGAKLEVYWENTSHPGFVAGIEFQSSSQLIPEPLYYALSLDRAEELAQNIDW